jgi:hypothetical protein
MTLERAIAIAATAHEGQWRNDEGTGDPYVLHPIALMMRLESAEARMAAVLHDVVEDCEGWDFDRLKAEGCPPAVLAALRLLTHVHPTSDFATKRDDESLEAFFQRIEDDYLDYVRRLADHPIARQVKWADLEDNIGDGYPTRTKDRNDPQRFEARMQRYRKAREILIDHWPHDPTHPSAGRFCSSGMGEFLQSFSVRDPDGNPIDLRRDQ